MNTKIVLAAGLALAMSAGVAMAQTSTPTTANPPPAHGHGGPHGDRGNDREGDGFHHGRGGERGGWGRGMRGHPPYATPEELKKRRADAFARMDANKDGKVTFEEFRQELERRKLERQHRMFERFSGGQDSVTLEQLNARAEHRFEGRGHRWEHDGQPPASGGGSRPAH